MRFLSVLYIYLFVICYRASKAKTHKFFTNQIYLMISGTTREILFTYTIPMVVIFWRDKMTIYRMIDLFLIDYSIIGSYHYY